MTFGLDMHHINLKFMKLFKFFYVTLPGLAILLALCSIITKVILKKNGYKVNYFVAQFFYETKILKQISKEQISLRPIFLTYYIVAIFLVLELMLMIIWFIIF